MQYVKAAEQVQMRLVGGREPQEGMSGDVTVASPWQDLSECSLDALSTVMTGETGGGL